jgi:hypothetical protein
VHVMKQNWHATRASAAVMRKHSHGTHLEIGPGLTKARDLGDGRLVREVHGVHVVDLHDDVVGVDGRDRFGSGGPGEHLSDNDAFTARV